MALLPPIIFQIIVLCHFNYYRLVWLLCSKDSQQKLEKLNKRALRLALSDYSSFYSEQKTKFTTVQIHSIRQLALEVFKTLHNLNPVFMKDYFNNNNNDNNIIMNHDQYIHKEALHLVSKNTLQGLKFLYF